MTATLTGQIGAYQTLLAEDRRPLPVDVRRIAATDGARRGAVALRGQAGVVRRAEPGPHGPLVLEARSERGAVHLSVWGPCSTPSGARDAALEAAAGWSGAHDRLDNFDEVVAPHPLLRQLSRRVGEVRLSRLPRVGEALGRAVLQQLVQSAEGHRSIALVTARSGTPASGGLWCWPTAAQLGRMPAWDLRRCGVSRRGARALHASATTDWRLSEAQHDWSLLDRRLRALPGVGVWTSAETRLALGDPDAVSVGDYNLPGLIAHVLGGEPTDAGMLETLAPFHGHRGRVIRLVELAVGRRLVAGPRRRAPRAAFSAHRYW